ncbi:MAG: NAD(+)/NADH kinase [Syntrophomonas sp.]|nr:NAD(+)/NADH kinase [Syntrophomonas sp.]
MKILLVNNPRIESTVVMAARLSAQLADRGIEVLIDSMQKVEVRQGEIDSIIVLGGDGTLIRTVRQYAEQSVPILGVNMGTVGFLSNIKADELDSCLERLLNHDYDTEERMILEVCIYRDEMLQERFFGLNELSIKSRTARMLSMDIHIAGREHGIYRGDGIIIATPTGSTAYSLSCGGPITDPDLEVLLLTPIACYSLSKRPMVINADKEISFYPLRCEEAEITIDGQVNMIWRNDFHIKVKKAQHKLKLINLKPAYFFQTITKRLQLNDDL